MDLPKWEAQPWQICQILAEILSGLVFIHEKEEIHRDLSPQNGSYPASKFSLRYLITL
jgi:serine/threonine protein kinase